MSTSSDAVRQALEGARAAGAFPMGSLGVWRRGEPLLMEHVGGASEATCWDLASLTKPMAVGSLAMAAVSSGQLTLDEPIIGFEPVTSDGDVLPAPPLTFRALLGHRSGLPAWKDLVFALPEPRVAGSAEARYAVRALVRMAARERDPGGRVEYSDLGYMMLGWLLEERLGISLGALSGIGGVFCPEVETAPTGRCPWRGRQVAPGEVHDPNAWVLGGIAGHAGLFGRLTEVGGWANGLLARSRGEPTGVPLLDRVRREVVHAFWDLSQRGVGRDGAPSTWVLGWDTPSEVGRSAGRFISKDAVGHLGFTGTSVWVDRARELVIVLLTNRVAAGAHAVFAMKRARPAIHEAVYERLGLT